MRKRCLSSTHPKFDSYGGRGITVAPAWSEYETFLDDMGAAPHGMSLERIDNNKGYSKENCVWADSKVQANNRRSNTHYTIAGEVRTQAQWCDVFGISQQAVHYRRRKLGWDFEQAVSTPLLRRRGVANGLQSK
jgi:hypothetical protein